MPPRTITPWTIPPDNCPLPIPPGQLPPGHCPHLTPNFFCFCFGTRSLSLGKRNDEVFLYAYDGMNILVGQLSRGQLSGGNHPGGCCPWDNCLGGSCTGDNGPGGNCPGRNLQGGVEIFSTKKKFSYDRCPTLVHVTTPLVKFYKFECFQNSYLSYRN